MWIASIAGLLTAAFVVTAIWIDRRARELSWPIRLTPEFRSQFAFRVPRTASYRVSVGCSSANTKENLRKLLQGGNLVEIALTGNGSAVPLHFFPEPMLRPGMEWGNIVSLPGEAWQDLAVFTGDPASEYVVKCAVIRPAADLDEMQPRLIVRLDPLDFKGDLMLIGSLFVLSIATAVFALVALIYYFIDRGTKA
jgi:hypothetical protein